MTLWALVANTIYYVHSTHKEKQCLVLLNSSNTAVGVEYFIYVYVLFWRLSNTAHTIILLLLQKYIGSHKFLLVITTIVCEE